MERRERYDPEDIEQLLSERGFDELLEEERAYVLRHLTGAEEYEAMRALLLRMRTGATGTAPIEADPAIRERVLETFRSGQRPAWRIWLNSVGAVLQPRETSGYWRPALALAGLALLIVAGITVVRTMQMTGRSRALAEKREEPVKPQDANHDTERPGAPAIDTALPVVASPTLPSPSLAEEMQGTPSPSGSLVDDEAGPGSVTEDVGEDDLAKADKLGVALSDRIAEAETEAKDVQLARSGAAAAESTTFKNLDIAEHREQQQVLREVVTVRSKKERSKAYAQDEQAMASASRSLAEDHAVLGLVNQGW